MASRSLTELIAELAVLPRGLLLTIAIGLGCFFIVLLTMILTKDSTSAVLLLDYSSYLVFPYPLTIQNIMYVFFFLCLGDMFVRWNTAQRELLFVSQGYLPEDDQTVLQPHELGPTREKVAGQYDGDNGFLPYLIDVSILQFQTSRSVDQAVSVLNSSLELISHRVDLRYAMIRYIVWAIPTIGFIGTVVGVARSLILIEPGQMDLKAITGGLAIAFNTTIMVLVLSAILVLFMHAVQKREEMAVNLAGNHCLKNLINRLFSGKP